MPKRYGTVPTRSYVPAGQKPVALRCPPGEHGHAGYPYCHPSDREHRVAHQELHEEHGRMKRVEAKLTSLGDEMYELARAGKKVPPKMRQDYSRLYTYVQRAKGTARKLPINRALKKDGGGGAAAAAGPGVGPMAPVDPMVASDVHVDVAEHRRRVKPSMHKGLGEFCGFSVLNLKRCQPGDHKHGEFPCHPQERAHRRPKGMRCPNGQHKHDDLACHPSQRKHRGLKKPEKEGEKRVRGVDFREARRKKVQETAGEDAQAPGNPYGSPVAIKRKMNAITQEIYGVRRNSEEYAQAERDGTLDDLREKYREMRELWFQARAWAHTPEGKAYAHQQKVARAKGQGNKGRDFYENKAKELEKELVHEKQLHERLYAKYREVNTAWYSARGEHRDEEADILRGKVNELSTAVRASDKRLKSLRTSIKKNIAYAGVGIAREWTDTIKSLTGGVEPQIAAIRTGSRAYAHYDLETKIIGISDRALELLRLVRDDPEILFTPEAGYKNGGNRHSYALSALFHEFLHSANPAVGAYRLGPLQWIEEGLTESIANRMIARPDMLSSLIGRDVDKGAQSEPPPKYAPWVDAMEYLAEKAAQKHGTEPEWFLGKWKFHTPATVDRPRVMMQDSGIEDEYTAGEGREWKKIWAGVRDELPKLREQRQAQRAGRENKAFLDAISKSWFKLIPGFLVRGAGINFTDSIEEHGGGSQGGFGPAMTGGTGGPGMVDSGRHTSAADGTPPKGVGFQKFPRQIAAAEDGVGGNGVGIVEPVKPRCEGCGKMGNRNKR